MADLALANISEQQHKAIARLHLKFTGDIHGIFFSYTTQIKTKLRDYTLPDGTMNPIGALPFNRWLAESWSETYKAFSDRFEAARRQAALISFGALGVYHNGVFGWVSEEDLTEAEPAVRIEGVPFFEPQLQEVIDAANQRVYSDGFKLSQRIWRLNENSLAGLRQIILETVATGDSAWNAAHRFEEYLGAGQDCPRWTSTRLFKLTKSDIAAGDQRGLIKSPCSSKGVSYNALRLARNEIQIAHQMANDAILQRMPWVEMEQIRLSPSHPAIGCECEGIVVGGENGDGVYPLGTITLPVHVQCLPPGQTITTNEGGRAIEDVRVGDLVLTHEGRYKPVMETMNRQHEGELIKITTESGRVLYVTEDHPILVGGAWVEARDLREGDPLVVPTTE